MVEYVTYNGEQLPICVSYIALKRLRKELNIDITNASQIDEFEVMEPILFYGLEDGFRQMKKEFPFKREEMEIVLNDCWIEFQALLPTFFPEEMAKMLVAGGQTVQSIPTSTPTRKKKGR